MTEIKKTVASGAKKTSAPKPNENYEKKIKSLEDQIEKLVAMVTNQTKDVKSVSFDEDVPVISLCPNTLNLCTGDNGSGEVYTFHEFGEEQTVPFEDLKSIVKHNRSFLKAGLFYIDDDFAIEKLKLKSIYNGFEDKDTLVNIFNESTPSFVKIFSRMPKEQQDNFASMIVNKLYTKQDIDMNLVKKCGDLIGRDLSQEAYDRKQILGEG